MERKTITITLVLLLFIVVPIAGKKTGWFGDDQESVSVETQEIAAVTLTQKVPAAGKTQPELETKLLSEVSGEIIELPIEERQAVRRDDLLVRINPDIYQSGLNKMLASLETVHAPQQQSEVSYKKVEKNYKRNKLLFDKGVASKTEWGKIVSTYKMAKAARESARYDVQSAMASVSEVQDNLKKTRTYSPSNGTISRLSVGLGEHVIGTIQTIGMEITRMASPGSMEMEVDVNESDIVRVNDGTEVNVEADAYPERIFKSTVANIASTASVTANVNQVTNFKVKIHTEGSPYTGLVRDKKEEYSPFRPGVAATIGIPTQTKKDMVVVPISAIIVKKELGIDEKTPKEEVDKRQEAVFVHKDGETELRAMTTGTQDNVNTKILSGVAKNEEIITGFYNVVSRTLKSNEKVSKLANQQVWQYKCEANPNSLCNQSSSIS